MITFAKITRTRLGERARALFAQMRGLGSEGDDEAAQSIDDAEVVQPLGLFARPVIRRGLEALMLWIGEETVAAFMINKSEPRLDVEEGETRLYGAKESSCRVRMRADGSIDVEAKSGAAIRITASDGANIVLNGGSLDVARKTDAVSPSTDMTTWMTSVATAINALATGSVAPPVPASFATITGGNTTVKA